jgi:hypothetical protein
LHSHTKGKGLTKRSIIDHFLLILGEKASPLVRRLSSSTNFPL